ncbi:MAG: tripartite tricarboxylate transporter TctB family protein [Thermodesulfobacteriota bacterium]
MGSVKKMITRSRVEGLAILLVALGFMWEARNVPTFYQVPGVPGPTTFPWILGIVFGLCGLWLLFSPDKLLTKKKEAADEEEILDEPEAPLPSLMDILRRITGDWHFYTMWLIILAYLFLMPWLGFLVATALLLAPFFFLLGERRWWLVTGLALGVTAIIYAAFALGLNVRLPLGVLTPLLK